MVDIHKLIAAVNPDLYCDPEVRDSVKNKAKKEGYVAAAEIAKSVSQLPLDLDKARFNLLDAKGIKAPIENHNLVYDAPTQSLEPIYFWILDYMGANFKQIDKITYNFTSTPGSGHFSEIMGKASQMQQEATRMMGNVNTVIKSILNIVYDLKEFKLKLIPYQERNSPDPRKKAAAILTLKQIWMDNVDIRRGQGSINALSSGQLDFVTLRDAFMAAESLKKVDEIDLNERVKRILKQRVSEFFNWIDESERSLKQRFEIEKNYLKTQVNTVKLYSRWIKPYLKAARKLEQKDSNRPDLVSMFSTVIFELTLLGQEKYDPKKDIDTRELPKFYSNIKTKQFHSVVVVEFEFRGIPQRTGQNYVFGGKAKVNFTSYGLSDQELKIVKKEMEKQELGEVFELIEGATTGSLEQLKADIDEFTESKKEDKKKQEESEDTNPFSALFSFLKKKDKEEEKKDSSTEIKSDTRDEKVLRSKAIIDARDKCRKLFEDYKKAHGMAAP